MGIWSPFLHCLCEIFQPGPSQNTRDKAGCLHLSASPPLPSISMPESLKTHSHWPKVSRGTSWWWRSGSLIKATWGTSGAGSAPVEWPRLGRVYQSGHMRAPSSEFHLEWPPPLTPLPPSLISSTSEKATLVAIYALVSRRWACGENPLSNSWPIKDKWGWRKLIQSLERTQSSHVQPPGRILHKTLHKDAQSWAHWVRSCLLLTSSQLPPRTLFPELLRRTRMDWKPRDWPGNQPFWEAGSSTHSLLTTQPGSTAASLGLSFLIMDWVFQT